MDYNRRTLLGATAAAASMSAVGANAEAMATARPNIVVILADDQGFSDWSCFGSEIPTPNIDALGAGGLSFTNFFVTPRCSPSRAALLTGAWPHQAGMGHLSQISIPGSQGVAGKLLDRVVTFAELLKGQGYFTAMAGKWHLGIESGTGPDVRGFDRSIASPQGRMYFPDQQGGPVSTRQIYLDGKQYDIADPAIGTGEWYSTDLFVDYSIKYIREACDQKKPFVLYLPFVAAHNPLMAPAQDIARFKGKYMSGWDAMREARFERQKKLSIITPDQHLPPRGPNTYNWDKLTAKQQNDFDTMMAVYAGIISHMDRAIGRLISELKSLGVLDNTLVLLTSDNGANAEVGPDGILTGDHPGDANSSVAAGMEWATLSNTPFRYFKHFAGEGGISTPLIVRWPSGIDPSLNGTHVKGMSHLVDVMATLLDVTGTQYPKTFKGHELVPLQGRSFASTFRGSALPRRPAPLYFEHEGHRAIRTEQWKLVQNWGQPWALYDVAADRSETNDLVNVKPQLAFEMAAQWNSWASTTFVDPWSVAYNRKVFGGVRRQNWGEGQTPKIPEAIDTVLKW
jgi:arylsulfatase A-like enzyme